MPNMTEQDMINDVMYDINNPRDPVEYEIDVPTLMCAKCKRRNIIESATKCPACGSFDLIPGAPNKETRLDRKHLRP